MAVMATRTAAEPYNLEAVEFVGDSVVDYLVTAYLFAELG